MPRTQILPSFQSKHQNLSLLLPLPEEKRTPDGADTYTVRFRNGQYTAQDAHEAAILREVARIEQRSNRGVWEVGAAGQPLTQPERAAETQTEEPGEKKPAGRRRA